MKDDGVGVHEEVIWRGTCRNKEKFTIFLCWGKGEYLLHSLSEN